MKKIFILLIISALMFSCFISCKQSNNTNKKQQLIIFHAGSLSVPFKQMKKEFEKENPGVEILLEAAGSVQCARKITDLKKECDIMASADYMVIDQMLIPEYTDWNIQFATNEMAVVYHETSKYSEEINQNNWYDILLKDDVIYGRSDPNSDPCGYRTVLTSQLAEKFYNIGGLSEKILSKNQEYIRPKEVDLLALLESNAIDYIFLYRSVAEQHKLKYIALPDSINLRNPALDDFYQTASTDIIGKEPGTTITQKGQAMVYGITILKNAPNKYLAEKFLQFVLSDTGGKKIMEENGQPFTLKINPKYKSYIPKDIRNYFKE
ncbi:MAG TPA: tungstate ABC transporter substrate-binding protein WtpA [Bacteroidales bacterium]|nr:tungstate ABC transporter substrate-binding protein WtpA [Bacteroidales bacterium]